MAYFNFIKQYIEIITYEDERNCFHSLDFNVRKINKMLEGFVQDVGSEYHWMVYEIQIKLKQMNLVNKKYWLKKGNEEIFKKQRDELLDTVDCLYDEVEKYDELKTWINQNPEK